MQQVCLYLAVSSSLAQPGSQCQQNTTVSRALEDDDPQLQADAGLQRVVLTDPLLVLFRITCLRAVPLRDDGVSLLIPFLLTAWGCPAASVAAPSLAGLTASRF